MKKYKSITIALTTINLKSSQFHKVYNFSENLRPRYLLASGDSTHNTITDRLRQLEKVCQIGIAAMVCMTEWGGLSRPGGTPHPDVK